MEAVLTKEQNLWWKRFVKQMGFKQGVEEWWNFMDDDGGESTEEDVIDTGRRESDYQRRTDWDKVDGKTM